MITIFDAANLSYRVYGNTNQHNHLNVSEYGISMTPPAYPWLHIQDVPNQPVASSSFYAELYLKCDRGIPRYPMIAVRGTDPLHHPDNIKVDFESWRSDVLSNGLKDEIPRYYKSLIVYPRISSLQLLILGLCCYL